MGGHGWPPRTAAESSLSAPPRRSRPSGVLGAQPLHDDGDLLFEPADFVGGHGELPV
jgi:hypothetical protein